MAVRIQTGRCMFCEQQGHLDVTDEQFARYSQMRPGDHIQNVLPDLSNDEREMLITGSHPKCFDAAFAEGVDL